uniref:Uncharacterized protein n=1 Tax=Acrobeloides nanus TaxID=290746 RepID=A0A914DDX0_9BILA
MENGRHRDRSQSGSSGSWSLVDVDNEDIELSSASSVHDDDLSDRHSDTGDESSELDEEEMGFSTEQPTDESMILEKQNPTEANIKEAMKEIKGDEGKSESSDDHSLLDKPDEEEAMEDHSLADVDEMSTEEEDMSDEDSDFSADEELSNEEEEDEQNEAEPHGDEENDEPRDEIKEDESLYIVDEAEILEDSAAKHFIEPTRVVKALDSLSNRNDPLIDQFFEYLATSETRVKAVILITVLLAAATGIGIGRLISHSWMCLQVPGTSEPTFQCFGSEQEAVAYSSSGRPYRNLELDELHFDPEFLKWNSHQNEILENEVPVEKEPEPLSQCKKDLEEAKAELNAKAAMNRYIRQHAKLREEGIKKELLTRLSEAERIAQKAKEVSKRDIVHDQEPSTSKNITQDPSPQNDSICLATENTIKNITQSIYERLRFWTNSTALTAIATIQPEIQQGWDKISSWLKTTSIFDLPFNELRPKPDFITSIPKMMKIAQTQVKSYAKKISTALTTQNFSSMSSIVNNYKKHPIIRSLRKKVESALVTLGKWSKDPSVCFQNRECDKVRKLAKSLKENENFNRIIGPRNVEIYTNYLSSFSEQQCHSKSHQIRCEQCWWTGTCPMQKCRWQQWQKQYKLQPHKFILRHPELAEIFQSLEWETPLSVKPCSTEEKFQVCDYSMPSEESPCSMTSGESPCSMPCEEGPCLTTKYVNKSNKPTFKAPVRPVGDGRPKSPNSKKTKEEKEQKTSFSGWLFNRDKLRAEYRQKRQIAAQEKNFWLFQRSKLRAEMRNNSTFEKSTNSEKSRKNSKSFETRKESHSSFYTENYAKFPNFDEIDTNWIWDRSRKRAELRKEEKIQNRRGSNRNENWMFRRSHQRAEMRMKEKRR